MASDDLNDGDKTPVKVGKGTTRTRVPNFNRIVDVSDVDGPKDMHERTQSQIPVAGAQMMGEFSGYQNPNPDLGSMNMNADPYFPEFSISNMDDDRLSQYNPRVNLVSAGATQLNSFENPHIPRESSGITSHVEAQSSVPSNERSSRRDFKVASGYSSFPNHGNVFSGLVQNTSDPAGSDVNLGIAHLSNVRSNLVRNLNSQFANRECHQSLPRYAVVPTNSLYGRHVEVPNLGLQGVTGQPTLPSCTPNTTQPSHENLRETMETANTTQNLLESSRNPTFIDLTGSTVSQDRLVAGLQSTVHQGAAASGMIPNQTRLEVAWKPFPASTGGKMQVVEDGLLPNNSGVQQASQHIPAADGRFSALAPNVSLSPSLKRAAMQTPPGMTQVQRNRQKITQPSTDPNLANASPSFTPPPQISQCLPLLSQVPPYLPPVPQIGSPIRFRTQLAQGFQFQTQPSAYQLVSHTSRVRWRGPSRGQPSPYPYNPNLANVTPSVTPLPQTSPFQTPRVRWRGPNRGQPSPYHYNPNLVNVSPSFTPLPQTSPSFPFVAQAPPPLSSVTHTPAPLPLQTLQHQMQTPRQSASRDPHSQHVRTNTVQPSPGPYNTNLANATTSPIPLHHNSSLPPVSHTSSARLSLMQRAQVLQRLLQTNPTHPYCTAALQRLASATQAYPPSARPSSSVPAQSSYPPAVHIKSQVLDAAPPLPLGRKCLLCKRDLTFTPEGPVFQPDIPPVAAVLPCGHTFHDHCLQAITPKDQAENPPCIPCALDET